MAEKKEGGWYCAEVACNLCTKKWIAVFPAEADETELECPACGRRDSDVLAYHGPNEKDQVQSLLQECGLVEYRPEE